MEARLARAAAEADAAHAAPRDLRDELIAADGRRDAVLVLAPFGRRSELHHGSAPRTSSIASSGPTTSRACSDGGPAQSVKIAISAVAATDAPVSASRTFVRSSRSRPSS